MRTRAVWQIQYLELSIAQDHIVDILCRIRQAVSQELDRVYIGSIWN